MLLLCFLAGFIRCRRSLDIDEEIEFTCDRPFLFAIREESTGTLLFVGSLKLPVEETLKIELQEL